MVFMLLFRAVFRVVGMRMAMTVRMTVRVPALPTDQRDARGSILRTHMHMSAHSEHTEKVDGEPERTDK